MIHIELRGYYLNTLWKQLFWGFYGIIWIGVLAWVRVIKRPYCYQMHILLKTSSLNAATLGRFSSAPQKTRVTFDPGQFAWITAWDSPFQDHEHRFLSLAVPRIIPIYLLPSRNWAIYRPN
jgi:predicted ferric reductase